MVIDKNRANQILILLQTKCGLGAALSGWEANCPQNQEETRKEPTTLVQFTI